MIPGIKVETVFGTLVPGADRLDIKPWPPKGEAKESSGPACQQCGVGFAFDEHLWSLPGIDGKFHYQCGSDRLLELDKVRLQEEARKEETKDPDFVFITHIGRRLPFHVPNYWVDG